MRKRTYVIIFSLLWAISPSQEEVNTWRMILQSYTLLNVNGTPAEHLRRAPSSLFSEPIPLSGTKPDRFLNSETPDPLKGGSHDYR